MKFVENDKTGYYGVETLENTDQYTGKTGYWITDLNGNKSFQWSYPTAKDYERFAWRHKDHDLLGLYSNVEVPVWWRIKEARFYLFYLAAIIWLVFSR